VGAQLRVYRRRIRSVQSTRKITKAMELIAASRIAKSQARTRAAQPYADEMTRALAALGSNASLQHPMLTGVADPRRAGILLITSDRGLAGGYNANAIKAANELAARLEGDGREVVRYIIGRKGAEIEKLKTDLQKRTNRDVFIDILEVNKPELDAQLVAENIALQLEKRVGFRRAMRKAVDSALRFGCKGIKVRVSGRLNGKVKKKRKEKKEKE